MKEGGMGAEPRIDRGEVARKRGEESEDEAKEQS
jgi:hypothetical protein